MSCSLSHYLDVSRVVANLDVKPMKRSDFVMMTLRSFICRWRDELCDYYGEDFGSEESLIWDSQYGDTTVWVIVDNRFGRCDGNPSEDFDPIPEDIKKKIKRAGKWRRDKLRHKWSYKNPMNRIHGYIVMTEVTNKSHPRRTFAIDAVCSSFYSKAKGIGSDLIDFAKMFSEEMKAVDLVLEVANEYSGVAIDSESEEEESEEEESEEEESEEEESEEEGEGEEEEDVWYPDEGAMDVLSEEFWKKCMRLDHRKNPVYNLDQEYLSDLLSQYFNGETHSDYENGELWSGTEKREIRDLNDPKEGEYGGFWYQKGKKSQSRLMKFYEMHGFGEDSRVHTDWCCFSNVPYPTMRFTLKKYLTDKEVQTQEMRDNPHKGARSWGGDKWIDGSFVIYFDKIPKGCEKHPWNHTEEDIINRGLVEGTDYKVWKNNLISKYCIRV